jgi:hypothetical protein
VCHLRVHLPVVNQCYDQGEIFPFQTRKYEIPVTGNPTRWKASGPENPLEAGTRTCENTPERRPAKGSDLQGAWAPGNNSMSEELTGYPVPREDRERNLAAKGCNRPRG